MSVCNESCRRAREAISLALDDELSIIARHQLDDHLGICPACRLVAGRFEAIVDELRSTPPELPSVPVAPQLAIERGLRPHRLLAVAAVGVASLSLAALSGSTVNNLGEGPGPSSSTTPQPVVATGGQSDVTDSPYYSGGMPWSSGMTLSLGSS
jgi:predicted anti-sigma-YlaC factor YlaD